MHDFYRRFLKPGKTEKHYVLAGRLLYLMRWFWWRVTAWCEIVAMSSSFGISLLF